VGFKNINYNPLPVLPTPPPNKENAKKKCVGGH